MPDDLHNAILQTLTELDEAIRTLPTAQPKPDFQSYFARLDQLTALLPRDSSPELRHYLQKKSYEKARLYLEGKADDVEKGNCRKD